jgi:hypothetical protein
MDYAIRALDFRATNSIRKFDDGVCAHACQLFEQTIGRIIADPAHQQMHAGQRGEEVPRHLDIVYSHNRKIVRNDEPAGMSLGRR